MFKVGGNKLFAMMTHHDDECELTVKLTDDEREVAMRLPYVRRELRREVRVVTARTADEESLQAAIEWLRESDWSNAPKHLRDAALAA